MANFTDLRQANIARQKEWFADLGVPTVPISFRGNELAGEMGEVLELLEHLDAHDPLQTIDWGTWRTNFAFELADTVISADLTAMDMGYGLITNQGDWTQGQIRGMNQMALSLGASVGKACNIIKKVDREKLGLPGSKSNSGLAVVHLQQSVDWCYRMAISLQVDLWAAVCAKFNSTSEKVGLTTRLVP